MTMELGKDGKVVRKGNAMTSAEALAFRAELLLEAAHKVDWDGDEVIIKIAEHLVALSNYVLSEEKRLTKADDYDKVKVVEQ